MLTAVLAILAVVLAIASLAIGPVDIGMTGVLVALAGGGDEVNRIIVTELRLPRTILACAIGATLGLAGAALQGYVRNPLASPSLIGASNAAAFGAVLALSLGLGGVSSFVLPVMAIAAAFGCVLLILALTHNDPRMLTLILAGLALSSLFGALISLALNLAPNPFGALEIAFWLLGSLADRSTDHLWISLPFMAASWILLAWDRRGLQALSFGEETAMTMGVDLARLRLRVIGGTAIGVGGAVAVSGVIGFVGLVVPHLVRPFVGHDPGRILLPSALAGACLLTAADCVVRVVPATNELRLGVVTALIGVPFFLHLLFKERRSAVIARHA